MTVTSTSMSPDGAEVPPQAVQQQGDEINMASRPPLTGQAKLVWENLVSTGNDSGKLLTVLQKNGYPTANKQSVSQARNVLRNAGYDVPHAAKGFPKDPPAEKTSSGTGSKTRGKKKPHAKKTRTPDTNPSAADAPESPAISRLNKAIAEIDANLRVLNARREGLVFAKSILRDI